MRQSSVNGPSAATPPAHGRSGTIRFPAPCPFAASRSVVSRPPCRTILASRPATGRDHEHALADGLAVKINTGNRVRAERRGFVRHLPDGHILRVLQDLLIGTRKRECKSRPAAWKPEDGAEVILRRPSGKGCAQWTINIVDLGQGASMAFRPCARTAKSRLPPSPHGDRPEDSLPRRPWPDHQSQGGPPAGQNG